MVKRLFNLTTMAAKLAILVGIQLARTVSGEPSLHFPLNAQLPPAARLDTLFSYSFSPETFQSDSKVTYTLGDNHPSWLSIESDKRLLYGTPKDGDIPAGDVVGQKVDLTATDDSGSTTMHSTLVVSREKAPVVEIPLLKQIKSFGNFSAPSSVLSYPSTDFSYSFDKNTFDGGDQLNYYAVSINNSPLPAWVQFDVNTLTFSGKTPPIESLIQPPQTFEFSLVASDIIGFSAASIDFAIVVGNHKLTSTKSVISINATRGKKVSEDGLKKAINLDQKPAKLSDLKVTTTGMPKWLSYDPSDGTLEGTPGDDAHSTNFTISFSDGFLDSLDVLVMVNVATGLFESTFEDMTIRPGAKVDLDLSKYFRNPGDVNVKITTSPSKDWLKSDGFKVHGTAPKDAKGSFDIEVHASSKSSKLRETEKLHVTFTAADGTATTTAGTSTVTSTSSATGTASAEGSGGDSARLSTGDILLATTIPILFIALVVMLMLCFVRRRRARRNYLSSGYHRNKISNPILGSVRVNGSDPSMHSNNQMSGAMQSEKNFYKTEKTPLVHVQSQNPSPPRSSKTLGGQRDSEDSLPPGLIAEDGRSATIRSVSPTHSAGDRRSWVTVEGDAAMMSGGKSVAIGTVHSQYRESDVSVPEGTRQVFPTGEYVKENGDKYFRRHLETTVPTYSHHGKTPTKPIIPTYTHQGMAPPPPVAYKRPPKLRGGKSIDASSSITSSSVALLPQERHPMTSRGLKPRASPIAESETSGRNWETLEASDAVDRPADLSKPPRAALTANNISTLQGDQSKSFETEPSFGSSENWRVIGKPDPTTSTYKDLVDGAQPGERDPASFMVPRGWGDDPSLAKGGLSREGSGIPHNVSGLTTATSGKLSDGSYKAFL